MSTLRSYRLYEWTLVSGTRLSGTAYRYTYTRTTLGEPEALKLKFYAIFAMYPPNEVPLQNGALAVIHTNDANKGRE